MIRVPTTSGRVAGIIAEPIQGVGGFVTPPKEYFPIVAEIVRNHGGIFISDEVQTAWGRTGNKWFGIEHWGVTPDIITSAKGLGNGMPIGLTTARPEVADALRGVTISTFGGNPVTNVAAKAVIEFMEEQNLAVNAAKMGAYLRGKPWNELMERHSSSATVRGMVTPHAGARTRRAIARPRYPPRWPSLGDGSRPPQRPAHRQGRIVWQRTSYFPAA